MVVFQKSILTYYEEIQLVSHCKNLRLNLTQYDWNPTCFQIRLLPPLLLRKRLFFYCPNSRFAVIISHKTKLLKVLWQLASSIWIKAVVP